MLQKKERDRERVPLRNCTCQKEGFDFLRHERRTRRSFSSTSHSTMEFKRQNKKLFASDVIVRLVASIPFLYMYPSAFRFELQSKKKTFYDFTAQTGQVKIFI